MRKPKSILLLILGLIIAIFIYKKVRHSYYKSNGINIKLIEKGAEKANREIAKLNNDRIVSLYKQDYFDPIIEKIIAQNYGSICDSLSIDSQWNISKNCLLKYFKVIEAAYGKMLNFIEKGIKIEIHEGSGQYFICTYNVIFKQCSGEIKSIFKLNENQVPKLYNINFALDTNVNLPFFDQLSGNTFILLEKEDYKTIYSTATKNYRNSFAEFSMKENLDSIPISMFSKRRLIYTNISKREDCCQLQYELVYRLGNGKELLVTYLEEGQNINIDGIRVLN